ncbi:MAG: hypothetical protein ACRDJW_01265 [Thermomicrobiales bacterium]
MIRALAVLVVGIVVLSGLMVGGHRLLAQGDLEDGPVTLRRLDNGSKALTYDLADDQVLVYVVEDMVSCRSYAIVGPGASELTMGAGTSVTFTLTDPAGEGRTRDRLLDEEC